MIKKAFTEPLKLRGVARGTNGDMKNINRYTNDMPTGRISEAASRRNTLERKLEKGSEQTYPAPARRAQRRAAARGRHS